MNNTEEQLQKALEACAEEVENKAHGITELLRFGRDRIGPSDIETTYYCEKKHDFAFNLSVVKRQLSSVQVAMLERDIKAIELKEDEGSTGHETSSLSFGHIEYAKVKAIYKNVLISGETDSIVASPGSAVVVERKFREIPSLPKHGPYWEAMSQARTYCYCLSYMFPLCGFNDTILGYEIHYFPKVCRDCSQMFSEECNNGSCINASYWRKFSFPFDDVQMAKAKEELDFSLGYWLMEREAKPTKHFRKWNSCKYKSLCSLCKGGA